MGHPITLVVTDDLQRNRLTVFFRGLLAIPHLIWLMLWGIAAAIAWIVAWFAALFTKRVPPTIHDFLASYLRYQVHVYSYLTLASDPFPSFSGTDDYPVTATIAPPAEQGRLGVFFRFLLALPAAIFAGVLNYFTEILAFFAWFVCLALGRIPEGMRNLLAFSIRFHAQTQGYLYLLTDRYPGFDTSV